MIKRSKMKLYLILGLVFLLAGCKTTETILDGNSPTVIDALSIQTTETNLNGNSPNNKSDYKVIQTAKPILCAKQDKIFSHLERLEEMPVATWNDETQGHPVILFMNIESGSSSVIEMLSLDKGPFKDFVCFISTGKNSIIGSLIKKDIGRPIRYLTF